jgi:hypothetical protein
LEGIRSLWVKLHTAVATGTKPLWRSVILGRQS